MRASVAAALIAISLVLQACATTGGRQPGPAMSAAPAGAIAVTPARAPLAHTHPLAREFPLQIGVTWSYAIERDDECAGKSSARIVQGAITETIVAAWQDGDAQVYELDVRTEMHALSQRRREYYVILNNALYRVSAPPERLIAARGKGHGAQQVLVWPVEVGRSFGVIGAPGGEWRVTAAGAPPEGASPESGRRGAACYRLQRSTRDTRRESWFCPGRGIVFTHVQIFGNPVTDEVWRLVAFDEPDIGDIGGDES
jgi:hypothetical protein